MAGSKLTDLTPAVVGDLDNDTLLYIVADPAGSPADKSLALSVLRDRLATDLSDDFATAAQGALAETAVQPGALAAVATSGDYGDLTGTPTLGTAAAADTGDFATAAQGAKADTAVQPADLASGLAGKQDADPALDALSGADVEAWGRSWLDLASQAAARSRLGLGTAAEMSPVDVVTDSTAQASLSGTFVTVVDAGSDLSAARPTGATIVYWLFDNGIDPADGANVTNSQDGDLYYVRPA